MGNRGCHGQHGRGDVFDVVTHAAQDIADHVGRNVLTGPLVDRDDDRIIGFRHISLRRRKDARGDKRAKRNACQSSF